MKVLESVAGQINDIYFGMILIENASLQSETGVIA